VSINFVDEANAANHYTCRHPNKLSLKWTAQTKNKLATWNKKGLGIDFKTWHRNISHYSGLTVQKYNLNRKSVMILYSYM